MNILKVLRCDVANGPGLRCTVFVAGCRIHCPGCFQPRTWSFRQGEPYDTALGERIAAWCEGMDGITILGGEPMEPATQPGLLALLGQVHDAWPALDCWIYTGCTFDRLQPGGDYHVPGTTMRILDHASTLVEGPFIQERRDPSLLYAGSANQRLLDLQAMRPEYGQVRARPMPRRHGSQSAQPRFRPAGERDVRKPDSVLTFA